MWAGLTFRNALEFRVERAKEDREVLDLKNNDKEYRKLVRLFTESEDAVEWNRKFLGELK